MTTKVNVQFAENLLKGFMKTISGGTHSFQPTWSHHQKSPAQTSLATKTQNSVTNTSQYNYKGCLCQSLKQNRRLYDHPHQNQEQADHPIQHLDPVKEVTDRRPHTYVPNVENVSKLNSNGTITRSDITPLINTSALSVEWKQNIEEVFEAMLASANRTFANTVASLPIPTIHTPYTFIDNTDIIRLIYCSQELTTLRWENVTIIYNLQ